MGQLQYTSGNPLNLTGGHAADMGDIMGPFVDVEAFVNGRNLDGDNLTVETAVRLGLSDSSIQRRGMSILPITSTVTGPTGYVTAPTPDQVTVTVAADGLVAVAYQATWNETVNGAATAAIFVDNTIASMAQGGAAAPVGAAAAIFGGAGIDTPLSTGPGGLMGTAGAGATAYTGDVTTGQIIGNASFESATAGATGAPVAQAPIGGPCYLFMAAGAHTISIRFNASSGNVIVKNRRLYVWTMGF